jgi:hypothetical protein
MQEYIIESMVSALKRTVRNVSRAKHMLVEFWADKIALVWDLEDVHTAANERGVCANEERGSACASGHASKP